MDDWDEEFLRAAIEVEEFHFPSQLPPPSALTTEPPPPAPEMMTISSSLTHAMQLQQSTGHRKKIPIHDPFLRYSPPRVLSQRVNGSSDALMDYPNATVTAKPISPTRSNRRFDSEKDLEIDRLKVPLKFRFL